MWNSTLIFHEINVEGDDVAKLISSSKSSHKQDGDYPFFSYHNDVVSKPVTLWSKNKDKNLFLGLSCKPVNMLVHRQCSPNDIPQPDQKCHQSFCRINLG